MRQDPFREDVELGIMIETPAAVMMSRELAKRMDFFSVGTNDLTSTRWQFDRQNQKLDAFYDPHHPAVLAMIAWQPKMPTQKANGSESAANSELTSN